MKQLGPRVAATCGEMRTGWGGAAWEKRVAGGGGGELRGGEGGVAQLGRKELPAVVAASCEEGRMRWSG